MAFQKTTSALTIPFVFAEWVYAKDRRDIHPLKDGTLLDSLPALKEDYERLNAAGHLAKDLLRTQMPGKPAVEILALSLACLRKLPLFSTPAILTSAFRLKLLLSEGLLHSEDLSSPYLQVLGLSRSFQELASIPVLVQELAKIDLLFDERLDLSRKME